MNTTYKVTIVSAWMEPEEHYFDDHVTAHEFARAMRDQQYKTTVEEIE